MARAAAITSSLLLFASMAHAAPTAQAILAASDAIRLPQQSFALTVTLVEYRDSRQQDTMTLTAYAKPGTRGGQFLTLLRIVAPPRDANKLLLKNGNDLWLHDSSSKSSIRLSPQQRLLGQAANGDVVMVRLAKDYHAELAATEDVQDGDRRTRRAYRLALTAVSPEVTYDRIDMWIDLEYRPVKARYYAKSGGLLKTAYFRKFQTALGEQRPTETVIIDGLDPTGVTVMRYSDYAFRDVPAEWLQHYYLPRFRPE